MKKTYNQLTYEYVKHFVENDGHTLLSEEYVNSQTKLSIKCVHCFGVWLVTFNSFYRGSRCPECAKTKRQKTILKNHGVTSSFLLDKTKETNLKKYGCENVMHNEDIKEKMKKTNFERYSCENVMHNEDIKEKMKKTNLERYGAENPQQNAYIALKSAKSLNRSFVLYHWKTNEELVCVGSYEKRVVEYLNANRLNFQWQPKIFVLRNNKTYRPDFYDVDNDVWIEIKGYMRKDAQEKWDMFLEIHPNAQLWDYKELKKRGII